MALTIALDRAEARAGEVVRGTVHGFEAFPEARGLVVALVHETRHMKEHSPVETATERDAVRAGAHAFELAVPTDAEPSFEGRHYRSTWKVEARVDLPHRRDVSASQAVAVSARVRGPSAEDPVRASARGAARFRLFAGLFLVADLVALAALYAAFGSVPAPVALAFVIPAAVTLLMLVVLALRPGPVERLELTAPRARWRLGEEVPLRVEVDGQPDAFRALEVTLKGEEVWVQSAGKTAHTVRSTFHEETRRLSGVELTASRASARRWTWDVRLGLPATGPTSRLRQIEWTARARVEVSRRVDPSATLRLEVDGAVPSEP